MPASNVVAFRPTGAETPLTPELFEQWQREVAGPKPKPWWKVRRYHYNGIAAHFETLSGLASEAKQRAYKDARLQKCSKENHKKERGTMLALFDWLETKPWVFRRPALPKLGKKDRGTRDPNRKSTPVELSEAEVERLISNLPETTARPRRKGDPLRPIRDVVLVEWDTSLRPKTIERLRAPEHWQPETPGELFIAAEIDKEEYERTIPLTPRLIEVFKRRAAALPGGRGLLFGDYQQALRPYWHPAAKAAGIDERRARKISVYDFRHAAGKRFLDATGNIRGAAFMLGHKNATSTHRYTRPDKPAAERLIDALAGQGSSESVGALAPLDGAEVADYTAAPREGGGIGRRTSLRCSGPSGEVSGDIARALRLAAEEGRWEIVQALVGALPKR
ncbi:MAG: tyrosine-type recombinase/integrase, partial [Patescibacteria group bacterium]|nr:tyrosine-type recombinase/integrase [Patescibacteria group bacterium]